MIDSKKLIINKSMMLSELLDILYCGSEFDFT